MKKIALLALLALLSISAQAEPLQIVTSGGFASTLVAMEQQLEKDTGLDIEISFGSSSGGAHDSIPERLKRGEDFDLIILSQGSLNKMTDKGYVVPETRTDLVRSRIGMAVKEGANVPNISTEQAFIDTLKNAKSIGYSASASGTYLSTKLWPEMGLWSDIEPKSKRVLSERVATVVARGELEIGFQQISEILTIKGAQYVGPIPESFQKVTTFSTGVIKNSDQQADAKKLISYLASNNDYVISSIKVAGLDPVVTEK